jgi:hypothetical protein
MDDALTEMQEAEEALLEYLEENNICWEDRHD